MAIDNLYPGNLILYKGRLARVVQLGGKKLEIKLEDGACISVRPKDVVLLHPGPIDSLAELGPVEGEMMTAWELLGGQTTSLVELTELAYGDFTPATAWAAWQIVADGLYFEGQPDMILAHSAETVAAEIAAREQKAAEERAWQAFVERVSQDRFEEEDRPYLVDVTEVAWRQKEQSRVLRGLGLSETPEVAHELLLRLGYWAPVDNPYPRRAGLPTESPIVELPTLIDEPRRDLTHLIALAIDDAGSSDPDDALSLDGERLWVHIADAAALVTPDSPADLEARARGANLYLPEGTVHMLPETATQRLGLGLNEVSPSLSFGLTLDANGAVGGLEIVPSWVRVTRLTYEEAEIRLEEEPFQPLYRLAQRFEMQRNENGAINIDLPEVRVRVVDGEILITPLPPLRSRDLVREAMLMTGEAVGRFAIQNQIPIPFTIQEPPSDELLQASGPAEMFALRRTMRPGQQSGAPGRHAGLGMNVYVQATSPLRRYLDLVVHQQLRAYLNGELLMDSQALMARVGAADAIRGSVRWAERRSIEHWTLVYLQQHPEWRGEGIVVEHKGSHAVVLVPELGLETRVYQKKLRPLDSSITLALNQVRLASLEGHFRMAT